MKILVIHGPNLNMLGIREPELYGSLTLDEVNNILLARLNQFAGIISTPNEKKDSENKIYKTHLIDFFQSNHEGAIVDKIQEAFKDFDAIIINPGAFTHYSYAIRDAIIATQIPTVEVHMSNIYERESFRHISVIEDIVIGRFYGKGHLSYVDALNFLLEE